MLLGLSAKLIALHAGTPIVVSQTTLTLMFVVLGVLILGIGYGILSKSKELFMLHRWTMSAAVGLTVGAIFLVMLPSAFAFYTDPDLEFFSSLSAVTLIHGIIGVPAIVTGLVYAFGDLPQKTKKWMRWTALFFAASLTLGVVVFLEMLGLLPM